MAYISVMLIDGSFGMRLLIRLLGLTALYIHILVKRVTTEFTNGCFIVWTMLRSTGSMVPQQLLRLIHPSQQYKPTNTSMRIASILHFRSRQFIYGMSPLQMFAMNPHAPAESIAALLDCNVEAAFCLVNEQKTPLDARVP